MPVSDENGHGTFLASVAAGGENIQEGFTGAASEAEIAVVKLKEAKDYLRKFYGIRQKAVCYQEDRYCAGTSVSASSGTEKTDAPCYVRGSWNESWRT